MFWNAGVGLLQDTSSIMLRSIIPTRLTLYMQTQEGMQWRSTSSRESPRPPPLLLLASRTSNPVRTPPPPSSPSRPAPAPSCAPNRTVDVGLSASEVPVLVCHLLSVLAVTHLCTASASRVGLRRGYDCVWHSVAGLYCSDCLVSLW
jgi:hypothetical protein